MPKAVLYRMDLPNYTCGYGTAARDLLRNHKYDIEEHILRTRREADAFKDKHNITTTPLILIDGVKVGGYTELRKYIKAQRPKSKRFWAR
ncbi:hypothetical protein ROA7450_03624 [Roseovarius albus]|uniref:Glutaredoxin domain-containing protein n=1 Tax=Roseovarius albus TaxID=1247867 RepID=A0A1X7A1K7_9RHOB|nr:glutaredoxin [Roseovarius albus]SLN67665.1 hypothetical protein ROA7450_03624 [Roseovarius albus]